MRLSQRTILISGGTSGIGFELAKQFLGLGNTVIVTGRDAKKLEATKQALPALHILQSDVSNPREIVELFDVVTRQFPTLDTLVNNAGIMRNLDLSDDYDLTDLTREIETNLSGPVRMVQQFLSHLKSRPGALIVNVSSGLAYVPFPISPIYCATKAGIHSYTQSLRVQLSGSHVTVVELIPPAVETPLLRDEFAEEMRGQRAMSAAELATQAISGIKAGKLEIHPGLSKVLRIMSRIAPGLMLKQMAKLSKLGT